ncbi:ECF transporter S component [bacterium]|nr:ECF transporter S component [bacterium]
MNSTVKLYSYNFSSVKTYLFATLFVVGNIVAPQLAHFVPQGGFMFLPIYFFTLIAAYKYGLKVGLLTALLSPVINHLLFGMPPLAVLPAILIKSVLLAGAASWLARRSNAVTLLNLVLAVLLYQVAGTLLEWALVRDFTVAIQDFRIGIPGMLLQIFGGFALLKAIEKA